MSELSWAKEISDKIKKKYRSVAARNVHKIPYTAENGVFNDCSGEQICWWTNGFWGGILWQLYNATGEENYRVMAEELEEKLDENLMTASGMDHDSGFRWLPTAVINYRLTGSKAGKNRGLLAADNLAGRFNPVGHFIRAWNNIWDEKDRTGWAIIDCMMNLPLLYWAYEELKDPRYYQIAVMHADKAIKYFIREDGSANHIVSFNPENGDFIEAFGGQGMKVGSSWTRGQSWALYGFTLSYIHTKDEKYLRTAQKVADYYISRIPESGLIPVDFCQDADCGWEDDTSAAIAACGLLELEKVSEEDRKPAFHAAAVRLLKALDEKSACYDPDRDEILENCTAAYHDEKHNFPIIYGDYYYIEAIFKLTGEGVFIW